MGKIIKEALIKAGKIKGSTPATPATPAAGGTGGVRTADWLYRKHKADQGHGSQPTDDKAPVAPVMDAIATPVEGGGGAGGGAPAFQPMPSGGQVLSPEEELRKRKESGLQI